MSQPAYVNLIINRDYRLIERISNGARGEIFRAEHVSAETGRRPIGLRLMPADHAGLSAWKDRWTALSHVSDAHLQGVHTLGQVKGGPYADWVFCAWDHGDVSLLERLRESDTLPSEEVVPMAADLCSALRALHEVELTHRAIRPSNILRVGGRWCLSDAQPDLSVVDFLRRAADEEDLSWLPPEALEGRYDEASDMWAIGAVLQRAFAGAVARRCLPAQVGDRIDRKPTVAAGTPPPLDLLFHSLSQPDSERRYTPWQAGALLSGAPVPPASSPLGRKTPPRSSGTRRGAGRRLGTWTEVGTALAWLGQSLAVGGADGSVSLIRLGASRPQRVRNPHRDTVSILHATETGLVSGGWDGRIVWMDAELNVVREVDLGAPVLAWSPSGRALTADGRIHPVEAGSAPTLGAGVSAWFEDDDILLGTLSGRVISATAERCPFAAAVLAGQGRVAAAWDGSIRMGEDTLSAGGPVRSVLALPHGVICGLHDGALLVLRGADRLRLEGHTGSVRALAFDGTRLASCGQDKQVLVWDTGAILTPGSSAPIDSTVAPV